jgi:uncharacterized protein
VVTVAALWEKPLYDAVLAAATNKASTLHGPAHWQRVAVTGRKLAGEVAGANGRVVALFALLHDSMRRHDGNDLTHPRLAAELGRRLRPLLELDDDDDAATLDEAIRLHDCGQISGDPTIGVCWDADRLDLPRVGITPHRRYLSTYAAIRLAETPRVALSPSRQFFHGGRRGLRLGDYIFPPYSTGDAETPRRQADWLEAIASSPEHEDDMLREHDRVYFTVSRRDAYTYASLTAGGGALYLVTPIGEVFRDLDSELAGCYCARLARVDGILDPAVAEQSIRHLLARSPQRAF